MRKADITRALAGISREKDPTIKSQKLASLCCAMFREHGIELVVVGGSAIEFYTEGAYASGDLDLCPIKPTPSLTARLRQTIMGKLDAQGGPRSWEVAGMFVDLLGPMEMSGLTPLRKLNGPYGPIMLLDVEELLVERILISVYPTPNPEAAACAKQLAAVAVKDAVKVDWNEVKRLARSPEYCILTECEALIARISDELKVKNPFHSHR